jgi:hypothetical protein
VRLKYVTRFVGIIRHFPYARAQPVFDEQNFQLISHVSLRHPRFSVNLLAVRFVSIFRFAVHNAPGQACHERHVIAVYRIMFKANDFFFSF